MFGKSFYNKTFRTYISAFGSLFSDIIINQAASDGKTIKKVKVPIIYSSKEQYYSDYAADSAKDAQMILPMITFVQNGFSRKDDRRTAQKSEKVVYENDKFVVEAPQDWEMKIKMGILAGSQNEIDQIIEQILYYFDPSFTIKLTLLKDTINFVHECPITLLEAGEADNNWMGERTRRRINWDLQFKFMVKLFGPIYINAGEDVAGLPFDLIPAPQSIGQPISRVLVDFHNNPDSLGKYFNYLDLQNFERQHRMEFELEDGTLVTTTEDFYDGKIRNIVASPVDVDTGTLPDYEYGD